MTTTLSNREKLIRLYKKTSKHSQYQIIPDSLHKIMGDNNLDITSRFEKERLEYIIKNLNTKDLVFSDIGANTGYFSIELLTRGAEHAIIIEGNKDHCDFIHESVKQLQLEKKSTIYNNYISFNDSDKTLANTDAILIFNVLHHAGDDYNTSIRNVNEAKEHIIKSINYLSSKTKHLIFQLGFNWKGNIEYPLFKNGTKKEMIDFIKHGTSNYWLIENIGIAELTSNKLEYKNMNSYNIKRDNNIGEFLNRPIFVMKSKYYNK